MKRMFLNTIIVSVLLSFLVAVSALEAQQKENEHRATGLRPFTPEEIRQIKREWPRVTQVKKNAIAIERINRARQRKGLPLIDEEPCDIGDETVSAIDSAGAGESTDQGESTILPGEILPGHVDNSTLACFPPVRSQGPIGSCTSWATTYYQYTHMVGLQNGYTAKTGDNTKIFSPKWTYNFVNGGANVGTSFTSNYRVLEKHGAARWSEFPYDSNYRQWSLDPAVWTHALHYRCDPVQYVSSVSSTGLTQVKELLNNGYVVVFGTYVNSWQYATIKDDPSTSADDAFVGKGACYWLNGSEGSHAMTIVGYSDDIWVDINANNQIDEGEKGALRIVNSWGTGWKEGGFTWLAYDALKYSSAVAGAPSTGRIKAFHSDMVYIQMPKKDYAPTLVGEFTLRHAKRNQLAISLGVGETQDSTPATIWYPNVLRYQGGAYAFNGTTTACYGTFVMDFTDIVPSGSTDKRYFCGVYDSTSGDAAEITDFKLIDLASGTSLVSYDAVQTVDAAQAYASVDYAYDDGNVEPVAVMSVSTTSGYATLNVDFDASASYDTDGLISSYTWDFGDGKTASGVVASYSYAKEGDYTARLTVADDKGATASDEVRITVQPDPTIIVAPSELNASSNGSTVSLAWKDNSDNENGFYIERSPRNEAKYVQIGLVGADVTTFSESIKDGKYYYRVKAFGAPGRESEYSNSVMLIVENATTDDSDGTDENDGTDKVFNPNKPDKRPK